jgi:hypothetical protein
MTSGGSAHLGGEEEMAMGGGGYFPPTIAFIGGGDRGGLGRPLGSAMNANVEPDRRTSGVPRVPLLQVADVWVCSSNLKVARAGLV